MPAPPEGAERLARVWPHQLRPFGARSGYVLVLGQLSGDSQMDESEIQVCTQLEKIVSRSLPPGADAVFRPHPLARPKPRHAQYLPRCEAPTLAGAVEGARFAVTVNSNAAGECLAMGCPVLCFGPALCAKAGVARQTAVSTLRDDLALMVRGWRPDGEAVRNYLRWLACRQWSQEELREGTVLSHLVRRALA